MFDYQIQKRVQTGMDYLDREFPGWWEKVDLETFDITRPDHCILGQVTGKNYWTVVEELPWLASKMGFTSLYEDCYDDLCYEDYDDNYDFRLLHRTWIAVILYRRDLFDV